MTTLPTREDGGKRCYRCGETLPKVAFYKNRTNPDGLAKECRSCRKDIKAAPDYKSKERLARSSDKNKARMREYFKRRRVLKLPGQLESDRKHAAKYSENNREKKLAQYATVRAVRAGKLVRASNCEVCGRDPGKASDGRPLIQAHHDDYSLPLVVRWLCVQCHNDTHRKLEP